MGDGEGVGERASELVRAGSGSGEGVGEGKGVGEGEGVGDGEGVGERASESVRKWVRARRDGRV